MDLLRKKLANLTIKSFNTDFELFNDIMGRFLTTNFGNFQTQRKLSSMNSGNFLTFGTHLM